MSNKLKNVISNLIGLGVIALGTIRYLENDNVFNFVSLLAVGLACFLFKMSETKAYLRKALSKGIDNSCDHQVRQSSTQIIGDNPPPDKEQK